MIKFRFRIFQNANAFIYIRADNKNDIHREYFRSQMASIKTTITEVVTALPMAWAEDLGEALNGNRTDYGIENVSNDDWDELLAAFRAKQHLDLFNQAWENGKVFRASPIGLRNRRPIRVEWRGPHKPPAYDRVPADIRVDYAYLISCKYDSKVICNSSPKNLFDLRLADRQGQSGDWYYDVSPVFYQGYYDAVRHYVGDQGLPTSPHELTSHHRDMISAVFKGERMPPEVADAYQFFCHDVGLKSAERWRKSVSNKAKREEMYWRLIRLSGAPYFLLGREKAGSPIASMVMTPWDWRQQFELKSLEFSNKDGSGQPAVLWTASILDKRAKLVNEVRGHVEVRWSHGKFSGPPEAKIYIDSPFADIRGYLPLAN